MKIDFDLMRKILLEIENGPRPNLTIQGYDSKTTVENCKLLYEEGLIESFKAIAADNDLYYLYFVGGLTYEGKKILNKIRLEKDWLKIKKKIEKNESPITYDLKSFLLKVISSIAEGVTKGIKA